MMRPDQTTGTPNCVRAYVFSCSDCADESSHFIGYLLKVSNEYKTKFDAAPDSVREKFITPPPLNLNGMTLPKLDSLPANTDPSTWMRISEGAPMKDVKPRWVSISGRDDSLAFIKRISKQCTTGRLRPCDPK
jgi:hypothetical protein